MAVGGQDPARGDRSSCWWWRDTIDAQLGHVFEGVIVVFETNVLEMAYIVEDTAIIVERGVEGGGLGAFGGGHSGRGIRGRVGITVNIVNHDCIGSQGAPVSLGD